ncbi:MAG: hypothetical protein U9R39_08600, partial [Campylobacterota bacterium]|nr:hypothetical protein [Campylobacterota bacterium]
NQLYPINIKLFMIKFFMNLKNNFIKLSLFKKIILYLTVVIFNIVLFYIYDAYYNSNKTNNINYNNKNQYAKDIKSIKSKIRKKENTNIIKLIEKKSELLNCFIYNINSKRENINLSVKGNLNNIINFLNFLQNHFYIKQFDLKYEQNILFTTISLNTKYFYNSNKIYSDISNIPNPFVNKIRTTNKKIKNINKNHIFKVDAIIDSNIFINNRWYKVNDVLDGKRVVSVDLNTVNLIDLKTAKVTILKVYNETK